MTSRPLHLFGPLADTVAPFIARLGVPVTTELPDTPDAHQLYCQSRAKENLVTTGGNLWMGRARAPHGHLGAWVLEEGFGEKYTDLLAELFPGVPCGTGTDGLLRVLTSLGYTPDLTIHTILAPHPEVDHDPVIPDAWTRHTTPPPCMTTPAERGVCTPPEADIAAHLFWQLSPEARDAWLLDPRSTIVLKKITGNSGAVHCMIWHRGTTTRAAVIERFANETDRNLRRAWLQGIAHWGTGEQLPLAKALLEAVDVTGRGRFDLSSLATSIGCALGTEHWQRIRGPFLGSLAILRLLERDLALAEQLVLQTKPPTRARELVAAADSYLSALTTRAATEAPHPQHTTSDAYASRAAGRPTTAPRLNAFQVPGLAGADEVAITALDNPAEALARLTEAATQVRGSVWGGTHAGGPLERVVRDWGRRATPADDFAVADWLQSFDGPVGLLAYVANGVLEWPTLTPATIAGITRARALSKRVAANPTIEELIDRIPIELVPEEQTPTRGARR